MWLGVTQRHMSFGYVGQSYSQQGPKIVYILDICIFYMIQKKLPRIHGVPLVWPIYTGVCMQQVGKGVRLSMAVSPCYKFGHMSVFWLEGRTLG